MKFVSFVSAMSCGVAVTTQSKAQMESEQESLTDYDRATVGLDELMGDLNGALIITLLNKIYKFNQN